MMEICHCERSAAIHAVESSKKNGVGSLAAQRTWALTPFFVSVGDV